MKSFTLLMGLLIFCIYFDQSDALFGLRRRRCNRQCRDVDVYKPVCVNNSRGFVRLFKNPCSLTRWNCYYIFRKFYEINMDRCVPPTIPPPVLPDPCAPRTCDITKLVCGKNLDPTSAAYSTYLSNDCDFKRYACQNNANYEMVDIQVCKDALAGVST